jgi:hypothetical protein
LSAEVIDSRYEIIEPLPRTETDSSRIYKARDNSEERVVALKVISRSAISTSDPNLAARLSDVAGQAIALEDVKRLEHPNILRLYDYGNLESSGDFYVASEYLRGITLQERIRRVAPFSLAIATDIAAAIAEALNYAHHQGVVHGDLTPANVVLSPEGQIKVGDFMAHPLPDEAVGSAGFDALTAKDVYELGGIIYQMLTGLAPTPDGDSLVSAVEHNPNVPPALDGIVQKAMHPVPAQRYPSAAALLADLRAVSDALRSGKPLAWSPLADKRVQRPPAVAAPPPSTAPPVIEAPELKVAQKARPVEEDDDRYIDDFKEPPNVIGIIVKVLLVLGLMAVAFFSWKLTQFIAVPNDVVVPNLIGKTFEEASRIAEHDHFNLVEGGADYSSKWQENQIYRQEPVSGRSVKAGKDVVVYKSLGPKTLTVPDLVGMGEDRALRTLQEAGLPVGKRTEEYSQAAEKGNVISQQPLKSAQVPRGMPIDYVVSKGKEPPEKPEGLEAHATGPNSIDITWKPAPHAETYTVVRTLDGETKIIAQDLKDTHLTDSGLSPNTDYTYTVTSKNNIGESDSSDAISAVTEASPDEQPVISPDIKVVPPSADTPPSGAGGGDSAPPRMRQFTIRFRVPVNLKGTHHVQLEVQDATGTNLVYDETREPGDWVNTPMNAFGNKVVFRVYLDGKLIKQQTK